MSTQGQIQDNKITVNTIHTNTELTLIQITEDKLRLSLIEHLDKLEAKNRWQFPLGILLALIPVLLTSEFHDAASIDKATWKAFFMFSSAAAAIWFVISIPRAFKSISIDDLVQQIKNITT